MDDSNILCLRFFNGNDEFLYQHPWHLGTDVRVARDLTETAYRQFVTSGKPGSDGVIVAKLVDSSGAVATYDGFIWLEQFGSQQVVR